MKKIKKLLILKTISVTIGILFLSNISYYIQPVYPNSESLRVPFDDYNRVKEAEEEIASNENPARNTYQGEERSRRNFLKKIFVFTTGVSVGGIPIFSQSDTPDRISAQIDYCLSGWKMSGYITKAPKTYVPARRPAIYMISPQTLGRMFLWDKGILTAKAIEEGNLAEADVLVNEARIGMDPAQDYYGYYSASFYNALVFAADFNINKLRGLLEKINTSKKGEYKNLEFLYSQLDERWVPIINSMRSLENASLSYNEIVDKIFKLSELIDSYDDIKQKEIGTRLFFKKLYSLWISRYLSDKWIGRDINHDRIIDILVSHLGIRILKNRKELIVGGRFYQNNDEEFGDIKLIVSQGSFREMILEFLRLVEHESEHALDFVENTPSYLSRVRPSIMMLASSVTTADEVTNWLRLHRSVDIENLIEDIEKGKPIDKVIEALDLPTYFKMESQVRTVLNGIFMRMHADNPWYLYTGKLIAKEDSMDWETFIIAYDYSIWNAQHNSPFSAEEMGQTYVRGNELGGWVKYLEYKFRSKYKVSISLAAYGARLFRRLVTTAPEVGGLDPVRSELVAHSVVLTLGSLSKKGDLDIDMFKDKMESIVIEEVSKMKIDKGLTFRQIEEIAFKLSKKLKLEQYDLNQMRKENEILNRNI